DGIRDRNVTGVQTCALPILTIDGSPVTTSPLPTLAVLAGAVAQVVVTPASAALDALGLTQRFSATARDANGNVISGQPFAWTSRSEERRVGEGWWRRGRPQG